MHDMMQCESYICLSVILAENLYFLTEKIEMVTSNRGLPGSHPHALIFFTESLSLSEDQRQGCSPTSLQCLRIKVKTDFWKHVFVKSLNPNQPADKQGILQILKGDEVENQGKELVREPGVDIPNWN